MTVFAGEMRCSKCNSIVKPGSSHVCLKGEIEPPFYETCPVCKEAHYAGMWHGCKAVEHPAAEALRDAAWSDTDRPYYDTPGGLKAIDVIEAFAKDNFLRGTALKYLLRAGRKGDLATDLRKAIWYIQREIEAHG